MKRTYEIAEQGDKRGLAEFLKRESQFLLPMVELVERTELAIDEVITVMGRATLEAVLAMSAEGVAGAEAGGQGAPGGRGGVVRTAERSGLPVGPEGAGGAAAAEAPGPGHGRGGGSACVRGDEPTGTGGAANAGDPARGGVDAEVRAGDPCDGRNGGGEQVGGEPGDDRGVGAGARGADGAAPGRVGPAGDLPGRDPIRGLPRAGCSGRGC